MVDFLGKRLGKPVMLIPHGVDTIRFSPEWRSPRSDDTLVLGYVGRLTPEKNVRILAAIEQDLFRRGFHGFRMMVVGSGVVVGMTLSLLLGRVLSRFLYGISGNDPLSLGAASLALLVVAFVACYLPARSASRVDPLVALRES